MEFIASNSVTMVSPRALTVGLPMQGHFAPFLQLLRLLARNKISFTVLCTEARADELSRYKANGEFGSVDVDFVALLRDYFKENPPSPFLHMQNDGKFGMRQRSWVFQDTCYFGLYLRHGEKIAEEEWVFDNPVRRNQFMNFPGLESFTPVQTPRRFGLMPIQEWLPPVAQNIKRSAGLLVNSFQAFEEESMELLRHQLQLTSFSRTNPTRLFAIGPFHSLSQFSDKPSPLGSSESTDAMKEIVDWLDKQQKSSVLIISLGSMRPLTEAATNAFSEALDQTRVPFFWVLRLRPGSSRAESLPPGFEARTRTQDIIRTDWIPLQQLLQHPSLGGFLSHCGWNSILEGISAGVPIAACPMYAEQGMNAKYLVEVLNIAVEVKYKSDLGDFDSEAVATAISTLMDETKGEKIRQNMQNMQKASLEALAEGGSSHKSFQELLAEILLPVNS